MIIYNASIHQNSNALPQDSLTDALFAAWADLQTGDAWPISIVHDGAELWRSVGPIGTAQSLRAFAAAHGVELPEA